MTKPTLLLSIHESEELDASTASVLSAAKALGQPVHVLVLGPAAVAAQAARLDGVARVIHHDVDFANAETVAKAIALVAEGFDMVIAAHSMLPRAALPRAAALCDAAYLADVTAVRGANSFVRPMYAGSVLSTVQTQSRVFLTVRASAFDAATDSADAADIVALDGLVEDGRSCLVGKERSSSERPDLTRARVVVAGGRGLGSAENMQLVEALADRLGGAVGASRAAVDAGFAPNSVQVGQTGKVVAPALYIAVGISGAIQHVAGIKDAKVIVAINKDPDAPIFSYADVGLVGDLFEVLPALTAGLPALGA
ncbi:electron transfer flavoprotein subunit alpha/FixB family protein [Rhodoferax sp. WC2427]|uniref:electron transfer flavoprotein subunit alpha/FixB family protein n=1 Tax=Rhodoferax sp. WC2427 TaxID=3234144 RepID=UPI00346664CB